MHTKQEAGFNFQAFDFSSQIKSLIPKVPIRETLENCVWEIDAGLKGNSV